MLTTKTPNTHVKNVCLSFFLFLVWQFWACCRFKYRQGTTRTKPVDRSRSSLPLRLRLVFCLTISRNIHKHVQSTHFHEHRKVITEQNKWSFMKSIGFLLQEDDGLVVKGLTCHPLVSLIIPTAQCWIKSAEMTLRVFQEAGPAVRQRYRTFYTYKSCKM